MNIEDTIMSRKCRREISEYGCNKVQKQIMICELCEKPVHPLDAHFGRLKGELITAHIDCWNKAIKDAE